MNLKHSIAISFPLFVIGICSCYSQDASLKIALIDSLRNIAENVNDTQAPYSVLYADGQITRKKKIFGFFNSSKIIGGYAEKYTLKDSVLIKFWKGSAEFLNKEKTIYTNTIESFVFKNEKLCFYKGSKSYDIKGLPDSLIFEVIYYVDDGKIIKSLKKGIIDQDDSSYFRQIFSRSKDAIKDKKLAL